MVLNYEAKIYPNKIQEHGLFAILNGCRHLYNQALEDKINYYKDNQKTLSRFDLQKKYKGKENYPEIPASIKQMVFYRLESAYANFFRKTGHFPRFKSFNRYRSFELRTYGVDYRFLGNKLSIYKNIGQIRMRGFRSAEDYSMGKIVKRANGWYVQYCVEVKEKKLIKNLKKQIGIDVGLKSFLVDSENNKVEAPKFFRKSQRKLKIKQRLLSKAKKGSKRRNKKRQAVEKLHLKIANQRKDFLHKLSRQYAEKYHLIAVEDLNVRGMVRNHHLAKSIQDASWSSFIDMLSYKTQILGKTLIKVAPQYTSQNCSNCGEYAQKSLSVRTHRCLNCGFIADRDYNASLNILKKARRELSGRVCQ